MENDAHYLIQIENKYPRLYNLRSFTQLPETMSLAEFNVIQYIEKDDFYREANNPGYILVNEELYCLLDFNYVRHSTQIPVTEGASHYLVLLGYKN